MGQFNLESLERSVNVVSWVFPKTIVNYSPMKWWLCFGNLLGLIRDKGFIRDEKGEIKKGEDLDVGIRYEEADDRLIMNGMSKFGYELKKKVINDIDKKPFYYGFTHKEYCDVCVFCFYKHGDFRYHTFDVNHENKEIPSEYVFAGVPSICFDDVISYNWKEINREVNLPHKYGTCLDWWYPNWLEKREGCSNSPRQIRMASCKEWSNVKD